MWSIQQNSVGVYLLSVLFVNSYRVVVTLLTIPPDKSGGYARYTPTAYYYDFCYRTISSCGSNKKVWTTNYTNYTNLIATARFHRVVQIKKVWTTNYTNYTNPIATARFHRVVKTKICAFTKKMVSHANARFHRVVQIKKVWTTNYTNYTNPIPMLPHDFIVWFK